MNKHPLSAAIVREAKKEHAEIQPVADFTALPGEGVTGRIGTGRASLLNLAALDKRGLSSDEVADAFNRASENGMSSVALADTFGVLAVFVMADEIKADTRSGLAQLKAEGITPWLLTGDNERAAHALAGKLGLENVNADLLPEAKLARIRELQGQGLTAMVGDGINDAPALAQADIGIAMGVRGTDSAIEAADIAVMDDRISSVATLVRLAYDPQRARAEHCFRARHQDHLHDPRHQRIRDDVDGCLCRYGHLPHRGCQRYASDACEAQTRPHGGGSGSCRRHCAADARSDGCCLTH